MLALREEHHLLSQHDSGGNHDCHPLIREYFGGQLQTQQPQAWQQAHERLYEYYKTLPEKLYRKFLPDTLEEMQPLFSAVAHGCAAGLHTKAWEEIYWRRINRKNKDFICKALGAFNDDLATVANFFSPPWQTSSRNLNDNRRALVLNIASYNLRAVGRMNEALTPMQISIEHYVKQKNWQYAAVSASNLSELQLTLGDIAKAIKSGELSVYYADQSEDIFERTSERTTQANALHQFGDIPTALALFQEAERLQQEDQPEYPYLYSLGGFSYCDLLLMLGRITDVLNRYEKWLKWHTQGDSLLSRALENLIVGRVYMQQTLCGENTLHLSLSMLQKQATHWLDQAVAGLRAAGQQQYLPLGLLARAALHRHTRDFARAWQDLQEVFDIANGSGMRLHLTDYHLEMARLLVAASGFDFAQPSNSGTTPCLSGVEGNRQSARIHIAEAERLIKATGYHRRDKELAELQAQL